MVKVAPKNGIPWLWEYEVDLVHNGQNFHEINEWLEKHVGRQGEDWSGYGVDNNIGSYTSSGPLDARKSVYLFHTKEHAVLFKTTWI